MIKKITLYYRDMKEYEDALPEEVGQVIVFRTREGGYGIRCRCHGWDAGDTARTPDGKQPSRVLAVAGPERLEVLFGILRNASYYINRFGTESEREDYLKTLEHELLSNVA